MESVTVFKRENVEPGMEYNDEPMDTNETPLDGYYEEGEINSSDDDDAFEQPRTNVLSIFTRKVNKEEDGEFATGLNIFNKDEALKKLDRAKRFALPIKTVDSELNQEQLSNLYRDLGIDKENERHYRLNVIHMRGTENMSTEDVLDYFVSYVPSHIEWVNDVSCNIVWMDDVSAARALLNMSKKIKNLDKIHVNADPFEKDFKESDSEGEEVNDDNSVDAKSIKVAIPPGFWRIGNPSKKNSFILLRFATRSDKKQHHAEKNSEYYKKYGNPHFGNIPGILSKSLRSEFRKSKFKNPDSVNIWKKSQTEPQPPINGRKNPWEELAHEWGKTDKVEGSDYKPIKSRVLKRQYPTSDVPDLRISLQNKKESKLRSRVVDPMTSPYESDNETWESKSKVPRMKMYADDEEKKIEKNLEKKFQANNSNRKHVEDLRSKINRKKNKPRCKFRTEKANPEESSNSDASKSENEYVDGDYGDWALEQYHDLRESLVQNKRQEQQRFHSRKYEDESDENEEDIYDINLGHRSPLQIEIDNDEYYEKKKD